VVNSIWEDDAISLGLASFGCKCWNRDQDRKGGETRDMLRVKQNRNMMSAAPEFEVTELEKGCYKGVGGKGGVK